MLRMIRHRSKFLPAALLLGLLSAGLPGCMGGSDDKPTTIDNDPSATEVENEVTGSLYLAGGTPAVGAKVRIYPVGFSPRPGATESGKVFLAITDPQGVFHVDSLTPGEYNILGSLDSLGSYLDSVVVGGRTRVLPPDTLDAPGSIVGYVAMQPNHIVSTATVEILGTQYFSNVDKAGVFRFPSLPAGRFSVRVSTTLPEYTPLYAELRVSVGKADTLADTLRMEFTGIPVVTGLRAVYDTLRGTAMISWSPVDYPLLQDYNLFRDPAGSRQVSFLPLARVSDTGYLDPIFADGLSQEQDLARERTVETVEYRVKAIDKSGNSGPSFGFVKLEAPSPAWVRTFMDLSSPDFPTQEASPNDTVRVVLHFRNPTRLNDSLTWFVLGSESPLRTRVDLGRAGVDTLVFKTPSASGSVSLLARMRDAAGTIWERDYSIEVLRDAPIANAGNDTVGSIGAGFRLQGSATQGFGSIAKWEWDIGNRGAFIRTSGPDTMFTLPAAPDSHFVCRLRVTDDDGFSSMDTLNLLVTPSVRIDLSVIPRNAALIAWDGRLYAFGGDGIETGTDRVFAFDPKTKSTVAKTPLPDQGRSGAQAVAFQDKILLVGGFSQGKFLSRMDVYDPQTDLWSPGIPMPHAFSPVVTAIVRGKLYVMGVIEGNANVTFVEEFDFASGSWNTVNTFSTSNGIVSFAVMDGKIYAQSGDILQVYEVPDSFRPLYATADRFYWTDLLQQGWGRGALIAWNGTLTRFGRDFAVEEENVKTYDLAKNAWTSGFPMLTNRKSPIAVSIGNQVYIMGGDCGRQFYPMVTCPEAEVYTLP